MLLPRPQQSDIGKVYGVLTGHQSALGEHRLRGPVSFNRTYRCGPAVFDGYRQTPATQSS